MMESFFQGNNQKWSMMRLLSFIGLTLSLLLVFIHPEQAIPLCTVAVASLAGKWLQKKGEPDA